MGRSGRVQSCLNDGNSFVLTILIEEDCALAGSEMDPGIFAVDNFLTEKEEEDILSDIEGGTPPEILSSHRNSRFLD